MQFNRDLVKFFSCIIPWLTQNPYILCQFYFLFFDFIFSFSDNKEAGNQSRTVDVTEHKEVYVIMVSS